MGLFDQCHAVQMRAPRLDSKSPSQGDGLGLNLETEPVATDDGHGVHSNVTRVEIQGSENVGGGVINSQDPTLLGESVIRTLKDTAWTMQVGNYVSKINNERHSQRAEVCSRIVARRQIYDQHLRKLKHVHAAFEKLIKSDDDGQIIELFDDELTTLKNVGNHLRNGLVNSVASLTFLADKSKSKRSEKSKSIKELAKELSHSVIFDASSTDHARSLKAMGIDVAMPEHSRKFSEWIEWAIQILNQFSRLAKLEVSVSKKVKTVCQMTGQAILEKYEAGQGSWHSIRAEKPDASSVPALQKMSETLRKAAQMLKARTTTLTGDGTHLRDKSTSDELMQVLNMRAKMDALHDMLESIAVNSSCGYGLLTDKTQEIKFAKLIYNISEDKQIDLGKMELEGMLWNIPSPCELVGKIEEDREDFIVFVEQRASNLQNLKKQRHNRQKENGKNDENESAMEERRREKRAHWSDVDRKMNEAILMEKLERQEKDNEQRHTKGMADADPSSTWDLGNVSSSSPICAELVREVGIAAESFVNKIEIWRSVSLGKSCEKSHDLLKQGREFLNDLQGFLRFDSDLYRGLLGQDSANFLCSRDFQVFADELSDVVSDFLTLFMAPPESLPELDRRHELSWLPTPTCAISSASGPGSQGHCDLDSLPPEGVSLWRRWFLDYLSRASSLATTEQFLCGLTEDEKEKNKECVLKMLEKLERDIVIVPKLDCLRLPMIGNDSGVDGVTLPEFFTHCINAERASATYSPSSSDGGHSVGDDCVGNRVVCMMEILRRRFDDFRTQLQCAAKFSRGGLGLLTSAPIQTGLKQNLLKGRGRGRILPKMPSRHCFRSVARERAILCMDFVSIVHSFSRQLENDHRDQVSEMGSDKKNRDGNRIAHGKRRESHGDRCANSSSS